MRHLFADKACLKTCRSATPERKLQVNGVPVVNDRTPDPIQSSPPDTIAGDIINLIRGFCMGAADTVPGVSGGTVALVLGHYERLLAAISRFDAHAVSLLAGRRWSELWRYGDLRFVIALGVGLVVGAGALASTMHWLLENRMSGTLAVFFGLVVASGWIVTKQITRWSPAAIVALVAGVTFAFWLSGLTSSTGSTSLLYLFLSASVAICAMILPGISGAFVLLMLGMYHPVMGMIKQFIRGDISVDIVLRLCVFAAGCLTGLLMFSRLLKWLLAHHHNATMAALVGLMIGSLRRVWPLQKATPETASLEFKERVYELVSPANWSGSLLVPLVLVIAAAVFVILIERIAMSGKPPRMQGEAAV